jgi:archaemetzincin
MAAANNIFLAMAKKICLLVLIFLLGSVSCGSTKVQETKRTQTDISKAKKITIALLPFKNIDASIVSFAEKEIRDFYRFDVIYLDARSLPEMAWYPQRKRYRADALLIWLNRNKTGNIDYIVGLTDKDISCTNGRYADWGIFGYGYISGSACVVSTFRLKKNANTDLLYKRFAKVLLHELGHNLGLDHCPTAGCIMEDAKGTIATVDKEKKELCPLCRQKLKVIYGD